MFVSLFYTLYFGIMSRAFYVSSVMNGFYLSVNINMVKLISPGMLEAMIFIKNFASDKINTRAIS